MISIKKKDEAFEILRNYNGDNPYILRLKKNVYVNKNPNAVKDFQAEFILKNHTFSPKLINKIVKIADWWGKKKKEDWGVEFIPKIVKVISYLGETETTYVCYIQYRKSIEPFICIIPKKAVLTNFLVKDYNKIEIDFDRYTKLSKSAGSYRKLLEHQETAVKFLLSRKKCILADSMGLGKTTSLSVAAIEGNFDSVLIICPASLKINWKRELCCYIPEKDITIIENFDNKNKSELEEFLGYPIGKSKMTKSELLEEAKSQGQWKDNRFVIVNYDIVDKFFENKRTYSQAQFDQLVEDNPMLKYINNRKSLIIIDEAHLLSNSKSVRYKTIKGLVNKGLPDSIYLATGTPITNTPANLFCVLNLLGDPITQDWEYYMKRYCDATEFCKDKGRREIFTNKFLAERHKRSWYDLNEDEKDELSEYLHTIKPSLYVLSPKGESNLDELKERVSHIYLRRESDILNLPEKIIHEVYYDLTESQKSEYNKLWDEYEQQKKKLDPEKEINRDLLEGAIYRQYLSKEMLPKTKKIVDEYISKGEKVVIACCYDEELYSLQEYYKDKCVIYNGDLSLKQKESAIYEFTNNDEIMVFIGNIKAAGVGITLIKSHILVFNDFDYVPGNNAQMSDRIHRIGQKENCHIFYQIFTDTQYEKMWNINLRKQLTIDTVIKKEEEK